ncbi:DUF1266 domain-containing protein [Dyella sp. C11]|uniref:DUF1266 domain-containing protein n=1 Tax=Dyella sp. C11 TaxID=2126991 RepID=UPI0013009646|nr:DUF1266 domain-containing protein [Dyella sp. C11]
MKWQVVLGVAMVAAMAIAMAALAFYVLTKLETYARRKDQKNLEQPPEREQLLCFGVIMAKRNGEALRILPQRNRYTASYKINDLRVGLAEAWEINDRQSAINAIQALISEGRRAYFGDDFKRLQMSGNSEALEYLSGADIARWNRVKEAWLKEGLALPANLSMAAYDYERIAWLARGCFHLGYLTEDETWRHLAWVADQSCHEFASWTEYGASFVLGRAATFSGEPDTANGVAAVKELLNGKDTWLGRPHLWQDYPLKDIGLRSETPLI